MLYALARLMRLSLLPSALADVAAGLVIGGGGVWPAEPRLLWLFASSVLIYHGAMVLNDWADRALDRVSRPGRPLPAGAIQASTALVLGTSMLLLGACSGYCVRTEVGWATTLLAFLAALYDLCGRGPWRGPLLLGACRALNLGVPLLAAGLESESFEPRPLAPLLLPVLYGGYVLSLSTMARLEDGEGALGNTRLPRRALTICALLLLAAPCTLAWSSTKVSIALGLALAAAGAAGLIRAARGPAIWTAALVAAATGAALRRLLVFTAAASLAAWNSSPAAAGVTGAILCGYPVSFLLRKLIPPT